MKKFCFALILILSWNTSFAALFKNKGPIFSQKKHVTQTQIVPSYVGFRVFHNVSDRMLKLSHIVKAKKLKQKKSEFKLPFMPELRFDYELSPVSLDSIEETYKDPVTGEYKTWDFIKVEWGLCVGFTYVMRQFHYFGFFDQGLDAPYDFATQPLEWKRFYQKAIDDVISGVPRRIPGFGSLLQFSRSEMRTYLLKHIVDQWALRNINTQGIIQWVVPKIKEKEEIAKYKQKIDAFLSKNFQPIVVLYQPRMISRETHVVRVLETSEITSGGCFLIQVAEVNGQFNSYWICPGDSQLRSEFMPNEELEMVGYYEELSPYCKRRPEECAKNDPNSLQRR